MADERKRLYRSSDDRWIAGVCGGLGDYFNVDANVFRVLFVIFALFGGSAILIYIILWIIMPDELQDVVDTMATPDKEEETE